MSSGTVPLGTYHRANALGAGAYGSVVTVYDENGNEFALKLFDDEESEDEEEDDDDYETEDEPSSEEDEYSQADEEKEIGGASPRTLQLGTLREISILRILRHENAHPNIIIIHDIKQANDITEEGEGDISMRFPGIAMPVFKHGTLGSVIPHNLNKKTKVMLAHGIISGIAYLHLNGIIHRDIKADNIMIEIDDEGRYNPVVIDFSLAKVIVPQHFYHGKSSSSAVIEEHCTDIQGEDTHSPSTGTPTYRAPECVNGDAYGLSSDMYSVGVALLELLRGSCIEAFKDKGAAKIIANELMALPDLPFANLLRGLLEKDPSKRLSAEDALKHDLFNKFGMIPTTQSKTFRRFDINEALPLEVYETSLCLDPKAFKKRIDLIRKIARDLDAENPLTLQASFCYSLQLSELDDCLDDFSQSQGLIDCVVLAHKFFEKELWDLNAIQELNVGTFKQCNWSIDDYTDNEATIWMLMDFCLYPRKLIKI